MTRPVTVDLELSHLSEENRWGGSDTEEYIKTLEVEVERLRREAEWRDNQFKTINEALVKSEQERDQLKERLAANQRMLASGILYTYEQLAQHEADVIQRFKKAALETAGLSAGCAQLAAPEEIHRTWVQFANHYSDQFHQQVKESEQ